MLICKQKMAVGPVFAVFIEDSMDIERYNSAYRLGIGIALAYVIWLLIPVVRNYADVVATTSRQSAQLNAERPKLSAAGLESELGQHTQFGQDSGIHCEPANRDWDYVCSYLPTPKQSPTRLQFGVTVDEKRWVDVSRVVPVGTIVPPPEKAAPGDLRRTIESTRRDEARRAAKQRANQW